MEKKEEGDYCCWCYNKSQFIFIVSFINNTFKERTADQMDDLKSIRGLCRVCLGKPEDCGMIFLNTTQIEKLTYIGGSSEVISLHNIYCYLLIITIKKCGKNNDKHISKGTTFVILFAHVSRHCLQ